MNTDAIQAVLRGDPKPHLPGLLQARMPKDLLLQSIPHWLYKGDTALHLAAAALNEASVKILLKAGADPDAENRRAATPLHYACDPRPVTERGPQGIVIGLLIDAGADLDHADKGGATPLHRAVRARSPEAVRRLLDAGASASRTLGKQRSTALHLAVHSTGAGGTAGAVGEQLEIIQLLLKYGADPKTPDDADKSALAGAKNDRVRKALMGH